MILLPDGKVMKRSFYIGVIGAGACSGTTYNVARDVGFEIGKKGWTLVCGGLGGVMEGAARGCTEGGGQTIGILPGLDRSSANPYIQVPIPTGLGDGRNLLVIRASDVLVAISGGYGTLSEIALALKAEKPVIGIETWRNIDGITYATDFRDTIQKLDGLLEMNAFPP